MKKISIILLVLVMVISLTACKSNDYKEAMEVFRQLNTLLLNNKAWVSNARSIRDRIYQLKNASKGGDTYNYASGATHNDGRTMLNVHPDDGTKLLE